MSKKAFQRSSAIDNESKRSFIPARAEALAYDDWYATARGAALFQSEKEAVEQLLRRLPKPWVEIGVGTGRFAQALGISIGLDPSFEALKIAERRRIIAVAGSGEDLPLASERVGAVLMAMTLCFLANPVAALNEVQRALQEGGGIVLGFMPRETPWADLYQRKGKEGHPTYSHAQFFTIREVELLLDQAGLAAVDQRCTLTLPPSSDIFGAEAVSENIGDSAGFVAILAKNCSRNSLSCETRNGSPDANHLGRRYSFAFRFTSSRKSSIS